MLDRSAEAPMSWRQFHVEDAIRQVVLDLAPDVVCFQELPNQVPFVETHDLLPATTRTHSGNLGVLVTHETKAAEPAPKIAVVDDIALLTTFNRRDSQIGDGPESFTLANVHFEPGRGAGDARLEQLSRVIAASPTQRLLIAGDTNMRLSEADVLFEAGFSGVKPPRPTWNSKRNRFRAHGPEFSAYFTRWFASPGLTVDDIEVHDHPIEFAGARFFLSDHFALSGLVTVS